MKKIGLIILLVSIHSWVKPENMDSLMLKLDSLPLAEQFGIIENLPFNDVIENGQSLIPILLKYENIAIDEKKYNSLAKIYLNLSLASYYLGSYEENLDYGLKALHLFDSLGNKRELGTMYGELGYQMKRRDLKRAMELMQHGIIILEDLGEPEPLAKIYDNYGVLKEINNQLDSAKLFYMKALTIKMQLNDSVGIPYSLNNIGIIYIIKENYDSAFCYLTKSTNIRLAKNDAIGLVENYGYFGQIHSLKGDNQKAIEYFRQSLQLALKHNYASHTKNMYYELSLVYERMYDYRNALECQKLYKQWADSLINIETNKAVAQLQVKFESAEKEKELLQKTMQLKQQKTFKMSILAGSLVLLFSTLLFFRNKILLIKKNERIKVQNAVIEGEQAERNRLALELHDSVANDLSGVMLMLRNSVDQNNLPNENGVHRSIEKLDQTHQHIRKLSHTLMPRSLSERGLKQALLNLAGEFDTETLKIDFQLLGIDQRLEKLVEFNVYCILQEALNNTLKHSKATQLFIECNKVDNMLFVTIEDNGIGFDTTKTEEQKGIGLQNVSNRVKMMNGTININSTMGKGTAIELQIPLK